MLSEEIATRQAQRVALWLPGQQERWRQFLLRFCEWWQLAEVWGARYGLRERALADFLTQEAVPEILRWHEAPDYQAWLRCGWQLDGSVLPEQGFRPLCVQNCRE